MNVADFGESLDKWGSEVAAWPQPARAEAHRLLETSAAARALHSEAAHIDNLLAEPVPAAPALQRQILESLPEDDTWQRLADWFLAAFWKPALAASCALLMGFAVGLSEVAGLSSSELDDVSMLGLSNTFDEIEDAL